MVMASAVDNPVEAREREMRALESQLQSSVRLQMEKLRDGLRALATSQDRLREAGDALSQVTDLCHRSETLIENFPFIRQVSRTHQNFALTKRVYDEFCALDAKVERCAALLEADQETGEPHNLLLVYHYLSRLEAFRKQTLDMMAEAPSTALYTIKRYFKKLDDLRQAFDEFYWRLVRRLFELAEEGQSTFIVSIVKVLWAMEATERPRFQATLDEVIAAKFRQAITDSGTSPAEDPSTVLEHLSFWQSDLLLVRNELVPRFPAEFNILDFAVLIYHRHIHAVISQGITPRPSLGGGGGGHLGLGPADILYLIGWVRTYHDELAAQLGISSDDLEPRLLDDREPELIATYTSLSRAKLTEWIGNLHASEVHTFTERSSPPETDADDRYITPAGRDLFQIVKQHIDAVSTSSRGRLLLEIVSECARAVQNFITAMAKTMEGERNKAAAVRAGEPIMPPNLEDYIIMLGNICLKWVSYVDDLVTLVEGLIVSEYAAAATKSLKGIAEAWVNLAKTCTQTLVEIIFRSLRKAMVGLFTAEWDGGEGEGQEREPSALMASILATFDDYFKDYQQHADTFLFNKLVADTLERLLISLLDQMRTKNSKLRMPGAAYLLQADAAAILQFFSTYRDPDRVKKALDPLIKFIGLVGAAPRMLFLEFVALRKMYPDLSVSFLEDVLSRRDDLDKSTIREVIESCKKKVSEEKVLDVSTGAGSSITTGSVAVSGGSIFSKLSQR